MLSTVARMSHGVGLPNAQRLAFETHSSPTAVMSRFPEFLGKLKGKSFNELTVRSAQAARARLERLRISSQSHEPSDRAFTRLYDCRGISHDAALGGELLNRYRHEDLALGRFFRSLACPAQTAAEFRARCPRAAAAVVDAAEHVLSGVIEIGDHPVSFGAHPDWSFEFVSGKRAPAIHWSQIAFLDPDVAGDSKYTWDLNRHQYFVALAQAYLLTGDDRYVSCIADHLASWMDDNPPQIGINWTSSLELALRAISWIWSLSLVRHSPRLEGALYLRTLKFLHLQARHIERHLSTYFSPNTHLTGEALGLLYIGAAFPSFARARHWRDLGARILAEQLERQVLPDGVYFEQSTYYHRYTTDFYLHTALLTRTGTDSFNGAMRTKLGALLDYLLHITRPDGSSPFIGDDDGGRLVMFGQRAANDFRDTLAVGAAVLKRSDYALVAGDSVEELFWVLGAEGIATYDRLLASPPATTSRAFPDSGYFVMRESWSQDADWALVRCGPHPPNCGAHAHADALALELSVGGEPILIDPGTYIYTASRAERDYFRSSAAHNTVTIDGRSSAEPASSPFKWRSGPCSRATAWVTHDRFDFFDGEHDGFQRLEAPVLHSRAVFFLRGEYWVICDRLRTAGPHHLALYWHWAPGIELSEDSSGALIARPPGVHSAAVGARLFTNRGQVTCERSWTSSTYGARTPSLVTVVRLDSDRDEELLTILGDSSVIRSSDCSWRAGSGGDAGALTIATASTCDTIRTGPTTGSGDECESLFSDAAWTWVRRSNTGDPLAFAIIQGRQLRLDGRSVFEADSIVDCALGQQHPDGWRVDVHRRGRWSLSSIPNGASEISCAGSAG